ncbi:MAG: response regulator transcription factor [Planctomycetes bacterium]|nr:response regulator transcription factor [Planctomycetota bacterium]
MDEKKRVLVIEDEADLREGLKHNLEIDGFDVDLAGDGRSGLDCAGRKPHDLVLLDLMLPDMDGLDVLRQLRERGDHAAVIILSARGQDHDKVAGLEYGADDYITKPFGLAELTARIRAVLRRTSGKPEAKGRRRELYDFGDLKVDFRRFTVHNGEVESQLSRYEADILRMLIDRIGEVVTRRDLLTEVWGYVHLPTTRTVDNHIARLRKKVEIDVEHPKHVITVHGLGYRFDGDAVA